MRFNFHKPEAEVRAREEKERDVDDVCYGQAKDIWEELSDASPAQVYGWVQNKLGTYPPTQQQWTLLLKIITFLLVVAKILIKRVLGKTNGD